jgi:signal transduction histidine kinase
MSQYGSIRKGSPQPGRRGFSIRTKIITLLLAPLVPLLIITVFAVATANAPVRNLTDAHTSVNAAGNPVSTVVAQLQNERALSVQHVSGPATKTPGATLTAARHATDTAVASLIAATTTKQFAAAATDSTKALLAKVRASLADLPNGRGAIDAGNNRYAVMTYYNGVIDQLFRLYRSIATLDDHRLAARAETVVAISRASEMWSREDSLIIGAVTGRSLSTRDYTEIVSAIAVQRQMYTSATAGLSAADAIRYRELTSTPKAKALRAMEDAIVARPSAVGDPLKIDGAAWQDDFNATFQSIQLLDGQLAQAAIQDMSDTASSRATRVGLVAIACILMLVALVFFSWRVARNLLRRVTRLRAEALTLALDRLPSVVERIRTGRAVDIATEAPPLAVDADELDQLSEAFTRVQRVAISAAVHEATLREGFNQVFLNIARRSQTLLHRQLALLDAMERRATDPEELEELFRIDHLATRMRRHAEDLVILAGSTPGRGWRSPVAVADVLRAAASEVEEYARVNVVVPPSLAVAGHSVNDIVHLLAELLENATLFSPPESQVTLSAQVVPNGLAIEVEDRGLGMQPEDIEQANDRLAAPPDFDPRNSSRLGLFVVAKLAERQGIQVTLRRSPYGGVTAVALIPTELVVSPDAPRTDTIDADVVSADEIDAPPPPGNRVMALAGGPSLPPRPRSRAETETGGRTADGLPIRIRQASVAHTRPDQSDEAATPAPSGMPADPAAPGAGAQAVGARTETTGAGTPAATAGAAASARSPEQMRSMLSSFQSAMARGRRDAANEFAGDAARPDPVMPGPMAPERAAQEPVGPEPPQPQPATAGSPPTQPVLTPDAAAVAGAITQQWTMPASPTVPAPRSTPENDELPPLPQRVGQHRDAAAAAAASSPSHAPAGTMAARNGDTDLAAHSAASDEQPPTSRGGGNDDN